MLVLQTNQSNLGTLPLMSTSTQRIPGVRPIGFAGREVDILLQWIEAGKDRWGDFELGRRHRNRKNREDMNPLELDRDRSLGLIAKLKSIAEEAHQALTDEERVALGDNWIEDESGNPVLDGAGQLKGNLIYEVVSMASPLHQRRRRTEDEIRRDLAYKLMFCFYSNRLGLAYLLWYVGVPIDAADLHEFLCCRPGDLMPPSAPQSEDAAPLEGDKGEWLAYARTELESDREPASYADWLKMKGAATRTAQIEAYVAEKTQGFLADGGSALDLASYLAQWKAEAEARFPG